MFTGRRSTEAVEGHEAIVAGHEEIVSNHGELSVGHVAITRHWLVITADGVTTPVEITAHNRLIAAQGAELDEQGRDITRQRTRIAAQRWLLMAIDTWDKWSVRMRRRGLDRQAMRVLRNDLEHLEQLRTASPAPGVMVDRYGAMAAD